MSRNDSKNGFSLGAPLGAIDAFFRNNLNSAITHQMNKDKGANKLLESKVDEEISICNDGIKKCETVNFIYAFPHLHRRQDDSEQEKRHPSRSGNNQYGASGVPKCYNCRLKKFRVLPPSPK